LIMTRGALSNIRDFSSARLNPDMKEHISKGILVAHHTEILCKGITRVFSSEDGGSKFIAHGESVNVKVELEELCEAMKSVSGRTDIWFEYFDNSPEIRIDRESFLYVMYALVDNAIKYADPDTFISFGFALENSNMYALKVKSKGLPITDPISVFRKFTRGKNAWRRDDTGLGIGCWAANEHMIEMGGKIELETDANLSVFIIHLPPGAVVEEDRSW